jgi:hypothetical protein
MRCGAGRRTWRLRAEIRGDSWLGFTGVLRLRFGVILLL